MIVVVRRLVHPAEPVAWSYQALTLCLIVACTAGRAALGYRPRDDSRDLNWPPIAISSAIIAAAVLPYLHSLSVGFLSDDYGLAASAREAKGILDAVRSTAFVAFYRPFVSLVWWLGDRLLHGAPLGYHILALVAHAGNALLVYALGRKLIGSSYGALMAALLFAVHPLHVEPISWPAASSDLLCAGFSLLSLLAIHTYATAQPGRGRALLLIAALSAFALALMSKEAAFALPGVAILMLVQARSRTVRTAVIPVAGYVVVLLAYLVLRSHMLGGFGGYRLPITFLNTVFPSNPMLLIGDFVFPIHATLLSALRWQVWWLIVLAMAGGALWWITGLDRIPAGRLWLWVGFVFIMAIPSWTFRSQPSASFEWSRFAYLPTIGLAWLFGDLCAGRGLGWRRSGAVALGVIAGCTALTVWYILPWSEAGQQARQAVAAGLDAIRTLGQPDHPPTLFVCALPEANKGAPVFANCYPQAIDLAMGKHMPIRDVSTALGAIHPDVMAAWKLQPGEYLLAFRAGPGAMRVVRSGDTTSRRAQPAEGMSYDRGRQP